MNPGALREFWLPLLGMLAVQAAVLVAIAAAVAPRLPSARGQRATWLCTLLALGAVLVAMAAGADQDLLRPTERPAIHQRSVRIRTDLRPGAAANRPGTPAAPAMPDITSPIPRAAPETGMAVPLWPAWLWLAGTMIVASRSLLGRGLLAWYWGRTAGGCASGLAGDVAALAQRLGLSARVRVIECRALITPIALGIVRPTVGLPQGFARAHAPAQRRVMLAHELAHLAARDPFWHGVAECVVALWWWHPLAWWALQRLRAASETAADEASLLVDDGPATLAACLVDLARERQHAGVGWLGIGGGRFRSGLGRRVERLLQLHPADAPTGSSLKALTILVGATLILTLGLLSATAAAWTSGSSPRPTLLQLAQLATARRGTAEAPDPITAQPLPETLPYLQRLMSAARQRSMRAHSRLEPPPTAPPPLSTPTEPGQPIEPETWEIAPWTGDNPGTTPDTVPVFGSQSVFRTGTEPEPQPSAPKPAPPTEPLLTRTFQVTSEVAAGPWRGALGLPNDDRPMAEALRQFLAAAGVDWGGTNVFGAGGSPGGFQSASGKSLFYNERTGALLVRANEAELEIVRRSLEWLNQVPTQVHLEVRILEITGEDPRALGFDWYLGDTLMTPATNPPTTLTGILTDPQFRAVLDALNAPPAAGDTAGQVGTMPALGGGATHSPGLPLPASPEATTTAILTDPQFRRLLQSLGRRPGVDSLSTPSVTTFTGRQAQIQNVEIRSILTGINPSAVVQPGRQRPATNAAPFLSSTIPLGPTIDLVPTVATDGRSIQLRVLATMTEFLGYEERPKSERVRVWQDGRAKAVDAPHPRFRVRQLQGAANVLDGHTLVLTGPAIQAEIKTVDQSWLRRRERTETVRKQLLICVTPTIVDPAGNRVAGPSTVSLPWE